MTCATVLVPVCVMAGADIGAVAVASLRVLGGVERPWPTQLWGSIYRWKCCSGGRDPCLARDRNGVSFTELLSVLPMPIPSVVYLKLATARSGDVLLTKCGNLRLWFILVLDLSSRVSVSG